VNNKMAVPKCSIVIRCRNEEEHIGRLLSGIMQQTVNDFEVIVVDSGSTDATLTIASRYPVKILSITPEEFTFGHSLNSGCQEASGEFIVIVSAHVYPVYKDWLEKLLAPFADPGVALVYGKQRGDSSTKYSEKQIFRQWFPDKSDPRQGHPFCNNANAAIRQSLWEELPYNNELTGLEDLDWAKRAMERGHCIAYAAEAEVVHVHREKPLQTYNRYLREGMAHKRIFPEQKFNLWDFFRMLVLNIVTDSRHAMHDKESGDNLLSVLSSILLFRLMQFWGTFRGFARPGVITGQLKRRFYYPDNFGYRETMTPENAEERRIDYAKLRKKEPGGRT
jgi:rhamnosyltransferase